MSINGSEFALEVWKRMDRARAAQSAVQVKDPKFFAAVSKAMFDLDPIGINFTENADEYDAEAGTVIPRLAVCRSTEDVAQVLLEEFRFWFGIENEGDLAIDLATFRALAAVIWLLKERSDA